MGQEDGAKFRATYPGVSRTLPGEGMVVLGSAQHSLAIMKITKGGSKIYDENLIIFSKKGMC